MNILVDNSGYALGNLGDVAMLQVATRRLRQMWPSARIQVVTSAPSLLARYCPSTAPVAAAGLALLITLGYFPGRWRLPGLFSSAFEWMQARAREQAPELMGSMALRRSKAGSAERQALEEFLAAANEADLLVVSGGGFFTDPFRKHAMGCLELLQRVQARGVPAAALGQGIGPLRDRALRRRMQSLFPRVMLFGLREPRVGPALLRELGVPASRIEVTGDDAIELARGLKLPTACAGRGLGVNVRIASYSGLGPDDSAGVRRVLHDVAADLVAPLVPLPIARAAGREDVATLEALFDGWQGEVEGSLSLDTPEAVADQVGRCRLVVSGSYHAAVFALSRGVPVVGLAASEYYASKFLGLAEMFGSGCRTIVIEGPSWQRELAAAVRSGWDSAETVQPGLVAAADRQVEAGRQTYERLRALL